jgi:hypothetical protein
VDHDTLMPNHFSVIVQRYCPRQEEIDQYSPIPSIFSLCFLSLPIILFIEGPQNDIQVRKEHLDPATYK